MVGSTEIAVDLFEAKLMKWRQPASDTGTTSIQTQFEVCRPLLYMLLLRGVHIAPVLVFNYICSC